MDKMTNVKALAYVLENCVLPADVAEKLSKMKEQTEKHNSAPHKKAEGESKVAQANAPIAQAIMEFMVEGEQYSIEDFKSNVVNAHIPDATTQKVRGIIAPLVKNGQIVGEKVKGKMMYHLATTEA